MPDETFEPKTDESWETRMVRDWLRKPFKPEQIGKLPATPKRPALEYVGHAAVTDRLNKVAPDWSYTIDNMSTIGDTIWIRGTMTIGGVSRPEFGDGANPKEALGNFIRRAAMRYGVGLDLWSREELESSPAGPGDSASPSGAAGDTSSGSVAVGETAVRVPTPNQDPGPDTSLAGGEAAGTAPGGQTNPPGASIFPLSPDECDHKTKTGRWLPTRQLAGVPVCPRCGLSALLFKESA